MAGLHLRYSRVRRHRDSRRPFGDISRRVYPDGPLSLDPCSTVLHYANTVFEGLKAYRDENGKVTLFRPDMNMTRMNKSAKRVALPVSKIPRPRETTLADAPLS